MKQTKGKQAGFSAVEGVLIVVIVAVIGFVGWYVLKAQKNTNTVLNTNSSSKTTSTSAKTATVSSNSPGASNNASLESDLNGVTSSSAQSNQDLNSSTTAINDKSTFTTVPQ